MLKYSFIISIALLGGCNKYGPEQDKSGAGAAQAPNSVGAASSSANLPARVAVKYDMPGTVAYSMRCDLNSVAGIGLNPGVSGTVSKAAKVVFNGWLVNEKLAVPNEFLIVLKGDSATYAISGVAGMDRPDVAEAVGSQAAAQSGFGFEADITGVVAGKYAIHLVALQEGVACDTTKILDIVN